MERQKNRIPKPRNPKAYKRLDKALKSISDAPKTREDRAKAWGVSPVAVGDWAKGKADVRASVVVFECTRYGLDMYEIYTGEKSPALVNAQKTIKELEQELAQARQELSEARRVPAALARFEKWLDEQNGFTATDAGFRT